MQIFDVQADIGILFDILRRILTEDKVGARVETSQSSIMIQLTNFDDNNIKVVQNATEHW